MEIISAISIIVSIGYLTVFLYESKKFKANNFFSFLTCLFLTIFICVYIFIGTETKNIKTIIENENTLTVNSNDSSENFQNNTEKDLEIIKLRTKTQSTRFGILNTLGETKYIIKEKDSNK